MAIRQFYLFLFLNALAVLFGSAMAFSASLSGETNSVLQRTSMITGSAITMGDVLHPLEGPKADIFLTSAPSPGKAKILYVEEIARKAAKHHITWSNPQSLTRISVKRRGQRIREEALKNLIELELQERGYTNRQIKFSSSTSRLYQPFDAIEPLVMASLEMDETSGKFIATIAIPGEMDQSRHISLKGRAIEMRDVPVLQASIARGEIIRKTDLVWKQVEPARLQPGIITHAEDLIGYAAKRNLRAGSPLKTNDIRTPILVRKNTLVTMRIHHPYINLSAMGRALDSGGKGDIIRLTNVDSGKMIQGRISGPDFVIIPMARQIAAAQ